MAAVVLDQVGKTYANGVRAVRDLDLDIADGELLVLVGPSGCGKTTTLRLIAGLETPSAGQIRIGEKIVNGEPPHRRDVALVFQRPALYPHLNVRANLEFGLNLRQRAWGVSLFSSRPTPHAPRPTIDEVARLLGLSELLDRMPGELSGGQQQRVALGRALVRRPAVFLLDEPLGNLDARLRLEMRRELHLLQRHLHATMIYVTHDQEEALTLGDRVAVMDHGTVQQLERPQVLYQRPANRFVAGFVGWPPMNLLEGELIDRDGRLSFVGVGGTLAVPAERRAEWRAFLGRKIALGIRPEQVRLCGTGGSRPPERADDVVRTMEVQLVEDLGPSRLVTLRHGGWTVTLRTSGAPALQEGSRVDVAFGLGAAHLFDQATGRALSHGRPSG